MRTSSKTRSLSATGQLPEPSLPARSVAITAMRGLGGTSRGTANSAMRRFGSPGKPRPAKKVLSTTTPSRCVGSFTL